MKKFTGLFVFMVVCLGSVQAETLSYADYLKQASQAIYAEDYDTAKESFRQAYQMGSTDTEKALALAKFAHMLAYKQKEYEAAGVQVENGLKFKDIQPVAEVTLLQVKAKCLMNAEAYGEAEKVLKAALELKDVAWSLPPLYLSLGDCYRFTGEAEKAIETYGKVLKLEEASKGVVAVAYLNQAMTYQYSLRNEAAARRAYNKALEANPGFGSVIDAHLSSFE